MRLKRNVDLAAAFGRVMREQRLAAGFTQESLAGRCGVDRTYPRMLEKGLRIPSLSVFVTVARGLNIHPVKFLSYVLEAARQDKGSADYSSTSISTSISTSAFSSSSKNPASSR